MSRDESSGVHLTWWGASSVSLVGDSAGLIIDPVLAGSDRAEYDYVLVSCEDHDHMHEPSLRRLVAADRYAGMAAASGCVRAAEFDVANHPPEHHLEYVPEQTLTLVQPKYTRLGHAAPAGSVVETELGPFRVEVTESSERTSTSFLHIPLFDKQFRPADGTLWPAGYGNIVGGAHPTVGFVVEVDGVTVWHPGTLQLAYDGLLALRGRIDVMLLPVASMRGAELPILNAVRPRRVVPIQYRPASGGLLPEADSSDLSTVEPHTGRPVDGADPDVYRREIRELIERGWHRSIPDAGTRLEQLAELVGRVDAVFTVLAPGEALILSGDVR
jgi:L-ascorbate metabolism protein UlaG (beta-lactamase superfamily)